jgi:hypothetical protein
VARAFSCVVPPGCNRTKSSSRKQKAAGGGFLGKAQQADKIQCHSGSSIQPAQMCLFSSVVVMANKGDYKKTQLAIHVTG